MKKEVLNNMLELKEYLSTEWTKGKSIGAIELDNVASLIAKENIKMEYTFADCVKAYCKAHKLECNKDAIMDCLAFMIEIGLTRHIIKNIQNFKYYGYGKYMEEK